MATYLLNDPNRPVGLETVMDPVYPTGSNVLTVGTGKEFATISAAVAASHNGDVILVDAGTYTNDFVQNWDKLTIIGVGGMVNMVATVPPPNQKAILTTDADLTLENFSFSGAAISADLGGNAAGIRYENGHLTLINDAFINNQNGVMGGAGFGNGPAVITVDHCLFQGNGSGTGSTHNIYIGGIDQLTVTNSIFEQAVVGHELKSRAQNNDIENNLFYDGPTGTASYDIDLPNGGNDLVKNNVIEKGPNAQNNAMVHFGGEGLPYVNSSLTLTGNTFQNDLGAAAIGVLNQSGLPITLTGNTFKNLSISNIASGSATQTGNVDGNGNGLPNSTIDVPVTGNSQVFTDSAAHTVTLTQAQSGVRGGGGLLTVLATAGQIVVQGGTGGVNYSEGPLSCANSVATAAGSVNTLVLHGGTVDSGGTDTITTGTYDMVARLKGSATVTENGSYDRLTILGNAQLIENAGNPLITIMQGASASLSGTLTSMQVQNSGGNLNVNEMDTGNGGHFNFTITGGSVSGGICYGSLSLTTAPGSQGSTIRLGDGAAQITANGRDTIYAGTGTDNVILSGQATVYAGSGTLNIFGRGLTRGLEAKVYGNGGTYTIGGDTGNLFYYGGTKASTVNVNLQQVSLFGGLGQMTINGSSWGNIYGGAGGIVFNGLDGAANVTTAAGSTNLLNLGGSASVDSWGTDIINGKGGNDRITVHGNATLNGGTGCRSVTLMGRDTLNNVGRDTLTITKGANVTLNVTQFAYGTETGATARVVLGGAHAGSATVTGGAAWITADVNSGVGISTTAGRSTDVAFGSGSAALASNGSDTIHGGTGSSTIMVSAPNTQIWGGSGSISIADGNPTTTGLKFIAGGGTASLSLFTGRATVEFGTGTTTVTEHGGGGDLYRFVAGEGGGTDVINWFRPGTDHLVLQGVSVASQSFAAGSAQVVLSDNTHLQINGLSSANNLFS